MTNEIVPQTQFVTSIGHSDFAMYDQYGNREADPKFPFNLRYEPSGEYSFPSDSYEVTIFDYL